MYPNSKSTIPNLCPFPLLKIWQPVSCNFALLTIFFSVMNRFDKINFTNENYGEYSAYSSSSNIDGFLTWKLPQIWFCTIESKFWPPFGGQIFNYVRFLSKTISFIPYLEGTVQFWGTVSMLTFQIHTIHLKKTALFRHLFCIPLYYVKSWKPRYSIGI